MIHNEVLKDHSKSIVIENKVSDIQFSELSDVFFEILKPGDISYTYRVRPAKSIGSSFVS